MAMNKKDERGKKRRDVKMEFIIPPEPQLPEKKISESQQIQLDIIAKQISISSTVEELRNG
jgi:hypothetical protein